MDDLIGIQRLPFFGLVKSTWIIAQCILKTMMLGNMPNATPSWEDARWAFGSSLPDAVRFEYFSWQFS
jgi:hypothetical protein